MGLVAPYLAYLRQDRQFRAGEAVTSRTFARLVSGYTDWLVTIDPHLHRYDTLNDIYGVPSRVVHAAPAMAAWIAAHVDRPILVGPDAESAQWVTDVAGRVGAPGVVMRKERRGDRLVEVSAPDMEAYRHHTPVVVDDVHPAPHATTAAVSRAERASFTDDMANSCRERIGEKILLESYLPAPSAGKAKWPRPAPPMS